MSHTSRKNQEIEKTSYPSEKTYRCHEEDQIIERAACPRQPTLKGVAHLGLLVVLSVVTDLEGSHPRGAGELEGLGLTTRGALRQGYAQSLLDLLDLRGGGPCRALGGVTLLRGCGGLAQHKDLVRGNNDRSGGEGPIPPTTPSTTSVTEAAGAAATVSMSWGRDAPVPSLADDGGDTTTADSVPAVDSSRTSTAASDASGGAEPPAPSYWRRADATDVMVSKIDGSANIRSVATSSIS
jgi:hypothetical protein